MAVPNLKKYQEKQFIWDALIVTQIVKMEVESVGIVVVFFININIQNNYYQNDDFFGDIALGLAALVGGYLYLTKDKER